MRNSTILFLFIIGAFIIGLGMGPAGAKSMSDKDFAKKAASGGIMEVTLGEVAQKQATNEKVRDFGQRMVTDHGMANQQLMSLAEKNDLPITRDMDKEENKMVRHLSKLKGSDFDRAYMHHMVQDHEKDVAMFEKMARDAKNPELKEFAAKNVTVLQEHLKMAKEIERNLNQKG